MSRLSSLAPALVLACLASAAAAEPVVIPGFSNPESVLITPTRRYVSNIGAALDPLGHDGDGFISVLDDRGTVLDLRAFTGLDAPKGMAMLDGRLYVADIDRVVGFDPETRQPVFEAHVPAGAPGLLNDIAVMGDRLLVTDTLRSTLSELDPRTGDFTVRARDISGANGIVWDADREEAIIVALGADFRGGELFTWSPARGLQKVPHSPHGLFDGVARVPDGRILVSDWLSLTPTPGAFGIVDPAAGDRETLSLGMPIRGPADFAVDPAGNALWIPATVDGAVVVLPDPTR